MKKVFLIILNWNGGRLTVNCLKSLKNIKTNGLKPEVVVIDNGSTDNSIEEIENFNLKNKNLPFELKILKNKKNLGYAEGNNVGIKYALKNGADYVCLLNNDTRVSPDFLIQLIKVAESEEKIGIVGGKIYFEKGYEFHKDRYKKEDLGKVIWYAGGIVDWRNVYAQHRGVDEVDNGQYDSAEETEYINGCLMLVKRIVFEKVGFLDARYFLYFEENDFCQRAKKAGFKLIYTHKATIWHLNAGSSGVGSDLHDYFLTRNRLLFGMKYAPLKTKLALIKESFRILKKGRPWQKIAVKDFYLFRFGKGSWHEKKD